MSKYINYLNKFKDLDDSRKFFELKKAIINHNNKLSYLILKIHSALFLFKDENEETILHFLAKTNNPYLLKKLNICWDKINTKNIDGNFPVHIAIQLNSFNFFKSMINRKLVIGMLNTKGNSSVALSVLYNRLNFLKILNKKHLLKNDVINIGFKPNILMWSAKNGSEEIFNFLIKNSFNLDYMDNNSNNAIDYAIGGNKKHNAIILRALGMKFSDKISETDKKDIEHEVLIKRKNDLECSLLKSEREVQVVI